MLNKVALITGAAKRIGAVIARSLHQQGFNVIIHYHHSQKEASELCRKLNEQRPNSAVVVAANLNDLSECKTLIEHSYQIWDRLDVLVNNASTFYQTPIGNTHALEWEDLLGTNVKAPFFLAQAAVDSLRQHQGCIVNIADIHAERPLKNYTVYCIAKAGVVMLTKSLARELGPDIRVNAVAPGAILWPDEKNELSEVIKQQIIEKTCLKRPGKPEDIAETVLFLINQKYITGQVIAVDGGRSVKD